MANNCHVRCNIVLLQTKPVLAEAAASPLTVLSMSLSNVSADMFFGYLADLIGEWYKDSTAARIKCTAQYQQNINTLIFIQQSFITIDRSSSRIASLKEPLIHLPFICLLLRQIQNDSMCVCCVSSHKQAKADRSLCCAFASKQMTLVSLVVSFLPVAMSNRSRNVKTSIARNPTQEERVCACRKGPSQISCRCGREDWVPLLPVEANRPPVRE